MNALVRFPPLSYEKVRFTLEDVLRMQETGILDPDRKRELIGGEIFEMASDGVEHQRFQVELTRHFFRSLSDEVSIGPAMTLRLSAFNAPEPDLYVFPAAVRQEDVQGIDILLAVEIANSSLQRDLTLKNELYARFGVKEYWVVDVNLKQIHVCRDPAPDGYRTITTASAADLVQALHLPTLSVRLNDLPRLD
jgi:Uma2 family endonuclease